MSVKTKWISRLKKSYVYTPSIQGQVINKLGRISFFSAVINFGLFIIFYAHKYSKQIYTKLFIKRVLDTGCINNNLNNTKISDIRLSNSNIFKNSILIIAELSIPQCTKYRVLQKKQMLEYLGKNVHVVGWTDRKNVMELIQISGIVIFYRVPSYPMVISYYQKCSDLKLTTFFDVDDFIFDEEILKQEESFKILDKKERAQLLEGAKLYRNALKLAEFGIASTKSLADEMFKVTNKPVYVLNNAIDTNTVLALNGAIMTKHKNIRIFYGSGTKTHDIDFNEVSDALHQILTKHKNVEFIVYGYLNLDKNFDVLREQIYFVPFVDANDYYKVLANADITIAPLKSGAFNDCKSNIKFLESAIARVPCVASSVMEFRDVIINGENGYLANSTNEWYNAMDMLISNASLRQQLANMAYQSVIDKYDWQNIAQTELKRAIYTANYKSGKKRILMVNVLFSPDSFGGATIVTENIIKNMQDVEFLVFCGSFDEAMEDLSLIRYQVDGIPVIKLKLPTINNRVEDYNNQSIKQIFGKIVKAFAPDLVHFHSIQKLGASMAEICVDLKIPYLITLHDTWWICERQFMVMANNKYCANYEAALHKCAKCMPDAAFTHSRRFYLKNILDNAALLLAPSQFQKDLYITAGFNQNKIRVNKNGVLPNFVHESKYAPNGQIRFAYMGGIAVHKGYYWLKNIFSQISKDNYILKLVNIEARLGSSGPKLKDWKLSNGVISVVPFFNQDNIDAFYADIDVLLFPSQWKESFGLTIREALLRNIWVITTDCGGPSEEVINGVNGNIVNFGDSQGFKAAIISLLEKPTVLSDYINPHLNKITSVQQQAQELLSYYNNVIQTYQEKLN